jgi:DNA-binding protein HU-beta
MNQSELIEKVAQAAELNHRAAGQAVRVSGLGTFNVAARPARDGRNPQSGETIKIAASKGVRFHAGKAVKDALNPPESPHKKSAPSRRSTARK